MSKEFTENMFLRNIKFIFALLIFVSTLSFFNAIPQKAHALVVPVADSITQAQTTITAVNSTALSQKEYVLDGILTASTKVIISNITNSIVTWINSGFQGSPAFITDPESFFTDVADQVAGNFIAGTELGFLCEPFSLDIRVALSINYSSSYTQRNYCRLSDVVSNTENFTKFTNGDFSQGGWNSWFEITQNPSNNPLGAKLTAESEMARRIFAAVGLKEKELEWGDGFLSYRECLRMDRDRNCIEYGPIQTPGSVIEGQLANTLGTGVRQLELADEINEIVGALVGQLVQTVFTEGLSSFSSGGSNYNSLRTTQSDALTVSCSPDKSIALVGEAVVWTAYVTGGAGTITTYIWDGEEVEGATGNDVYVSYPETGRKTAAVRVTRGGQNIFQRCSASVTIQ